MIILFFLNMVLLAGKMAKFTAGGGGVTLRWTSIPSRWGGGGGGREEKLYFWLLGATGINQNQNLQLFLDSFIFSHLLFCRNFTVYDMPM